MSKNIVHYFLLLTAMKAEMKIAKCARITSVRKKYDYLLGVLCYDCTYCKKTVCGK